jgi:hypothetical protein
MACYVNQPEEREVADGFRHGEARTRLCAARWRAGTTPEQIVLRNAIFKLELIE